MAIVRATKTGNWSDTTVWNTGALPTAADDVYSNTFTVTIDQSATVLQISNAAASGVTAGGGFTMSAGGYTLTANVNAGTGSSCLTVSVGAGSTANVIGNLTGPTINATGGIAIVFSGTGTLNVTGSVTAAPSIGGNNHGISVTSTGFLNVTGSVTGSNGSATSYGIRDGNVTITGNATAGAGSAAVFSNNANFSLNHTGTVTGANNVAGIFSSSTSASVTATGPFLVSANGTHAISCPNWRWASAQPVSYYQVRTVVSGAIRPLYTADSVGGNPATSNVRSGTVYGPSNELTGTCAVPGAASVLSGVPVDNTTGTATISAADIRAAVGLASANLDAQFAAIPAAPSAAAIRTEMDSNSTKLANLDATVSSRLASSSYSAPLDAAGTRSAVGLASANLDTQLDAIPTAAENATANRSELAPELAHLDADVSSRQATLARLQNVATTQEVGDIVEGAM